MVYLDTNEPYDKPVVALHKAALMMSEASKQMELHEFSFEFLEDFLPPSGDGFDSACLEHLESLIE